MHLVPFLTYLSCLFTTSVAFSVAATSSQVKKNTLRQTSKLGVASAEAISVADLPRGMGGRIEEAFAASKERGEAAFITFVTAGYPAARGTLSKGAG
jgi:hypothetical protein